jgi:hypothetical protein
LEGAELPRTHHAVNAEPLSAAEMITEPPGERITIWACVETLAEVVALQVGPPVILNGPLIEALPV